MARVELEWGNERTRDLVPQTEEAWWLVAFVADMRWEEPLPLRMITTTKGLEMICLQRHLPDAKLGGPGLLVLGVSKEEENKDFLLHLGCEDVNGVMRVRPPQFSIYSEFRRMAQESVEIQRLPQVQLASHFAERTRGVNAGAVLAQAVIRYGYKFPQMPQTLTQFKNQHPQSSVYWPWPKAKKFSRI